MSSSTEAEPVNAHRHRQLALSPAESCQRFSASPTSSATSPSSSASSASCTPPPVTTTTANAQQQEPNQMMSHLFPAFAATNIDLSPSGSSTTADGQPFNNIFNAFASKNAAALALLMGANNNNGLNATNNNNNNSSSRIKIKRCRQRVDAGEPRNSYQSQLLKSAGSGGSKCASAPLFSIASDSVGTSSASPVFDDSRSGAASSCSDTDQQQCCSMTNNNGPSGSNNNNNSGLRFGSSSSRRKSFQPKRQRGNNDSHHLVESARLSDAAPETGSDRCGSEPMNPMFLEASKSGTVVSSPQIKRSPTHIAYGGGDNDDANNNNNNDNDDALLLKELMPVCSTSGSDKLAEEGTETEETSNNNEGDVLLSSDGEEDDGAAGRKQKNNNNSTSFIVDELLFCQQPRESKEMISRVTSPEKTENEKSIQQQQHSNNSLLSQLFWPNNNSNKLLNNSGVAESNNNNNNHNNKLQEMLIEQQKRFYATFLGQQQQNEAKLLPETTTGPTTTLADQDLGEKVASQKKNDLMNPIGDINGIFRVLELCRQQQQHQQQSTIVGEQHQQQQRISASPPPQPAPPPSFPSCAAASHHSLMPTLLAAAAANNPALAAFAAAAAATAAAAAQRNTVMQNTNGGSGGGIFPQLGASFKNLQLFQQSHQHSTSPPHINHNYRVRSVGDDCAPRRKRAKVTDTVRGPRTRNLPNYTNMSGGDNSLPVSERASPQQQNAVAYFPPTMVQPSSGNPFYAGLFDGAAAASSILRVAAGNEEAALSDECAEFGGLLLSNNNNGHGLMVPKRTLTHVHLRKAKLMFFYTRYPSSAVLKTYFPDIQFDKSNTAQLVKWFSNFREFYYMQMEKYAKQAIAEGIRNRNEIFVNAESEIYKQLNQHYNRNNVIEPPKRLEHVIQETLREFYVALLAQKDREPSWKKVIYKVIQQLDEPIPDYFKDPNFIETLEQS